MKVAVITNEALKEELLAQGLQEGIEVLWLTTPEAVPAAPVCIDLLFDNSQERLALLEQLPAGLIFVNTAFIHPTGKIIPFNGWSTLLKRNILEAACNDRALKEKASEVLVAFGKTIEWVPAGQGFISARVISMIINEAYLALEEGVSTKEEIDTAMKLGTNYPYGPFEWSKRIGLKNISDLLNRLAASNPRYTPSLLLQQEAGVI